MENNIQTFAHPQFGEIRVENRNGEPWFVGKEVAEKMGYKDGSRAVSQHVSQEDKTSMVIRQSGSNYKAVTMLINESGLYSLIFGSVMPQAREFKRWVTSEVLPQIRKTGGYIPLGQRTTEDGEQLPEDGEQPLSDADILARALMIAQQTLVLKNQKLAEQGDIIVELAPDAAYAQQVLMAPGCYTMTEVAKGLSMTVLELTHKLMQLGIIYTGPGSKHMLYKPFLKHGYEAYRTSLRRTEHDYPTADSYLVWTERGRQFVHSLINNN